MPTHAHNHQKETSLTRIRYMKKPKDPSTSSKKLPLQNSVLRITKHFLPPTREGILYAISCGFYSGPGWGPHKRKLLSEALGIPPFGSRVRELCPHCGRKYTKKTLEEGGIGLPSYPAPASYTQAVYILRRYFRAYRNAVGVQEEHEYLPPKKRREISAKLVKSILMSADGFDQIVDDYHPRDRYLNKITLKDPESVVIETLLDCVNHTHWLPKGFPDKLPEKGPLSLSESAENWFFDGVAENPSKDAWFKWCEVNTAWPSTVVERVFSKFATAGRRLPDE